MAELTTFQHNIDCRKEAEEVIDLCGARPSRFWQELIRLANEKLPQSQVEKTTTPEHGQRAAGLDSLKTCFCFTC